MRCCRFVWTSPTETPTSRRSSRHTTISVGWTSWSTTPGYGQFGFVEELSEQEARDQIETNVFGALWITQAALPYLREQRSGHIIQVSSIGGITAFPLVGIYHASKWALEGFSQALAQEVAPFGVHVTLIEPGGFDTDWAGPSAKHAAALPDYDEVRAAVEAERSKRWASPGNPEASAAALMKVIDAEQPPLRVFFGASPLATAKADYDSRLRNWEQWQPVAELAQGYVTPPAHIAAATCATCGLARAATALPRSGRATRRR